VDRPWNALSSYDGAAAASRKLSQGLSETANSIPFIEGITVLSPHGQSAISLRGTLRLNGCLTHGPVFFAEIETVRLTEGDARLKDMSIQFWSENAYDDGEPDALFFVSN